MLFLVESRSQNTIDQLKTIGRELSMGTQGNWLSSKEYLDLVKAIGEAKSKAEEESIVMAEIEHLKKRIMEPDVPRKKMKEYIIRLVYVEMLGHDASFGYIYAVKMTHDDNLLCKRSGYLATTLFLNEDHDLIILIVNTIQKDLKSDNYLVVCAALTAVCKLINEETIPAVLPQVVDLLGHPKEQVRKKAVMALHRFQQRSPSSMSHLLTKFRQVGCVGRVRSKNFRFSTTVKLRLGRAAAWTSSSCVRLFLQMPSSGVFECLTAARAGVLSS